MNKIKKQRPIQEWIISKSKAKFGGWHIQARTKDQMSSFVVIAENVQGLTRNKAVDGCDVFSLLDYKTMATMNVYGKIEYAGEWL